MNAVVFRSVHQQKFLKKCMKNPPMCCVSDPDRHITEPDREIHQDQQSKIQGTKVDTHLLWQSAHSLFSGSFIRASNICNINQPSQHLISKPTFHSGRNSKILSWAHWHEGRECKFPCRLQSEIVLRHFTNKSSYRTQTARFTELSHR